MGEGGEGGVGGVGEGFEGGRYRSLGATESTECCDASATTDDGGEELGMGIRHREYPIECVQFHPESVLTGVGHDVSDNFLRQAVGTAGVENREQSV